MYSVLFVCVLCGAGIAAVNHLYVSKYPYGGFGYNGTTYIICNSWAGNEVPVVGDSFNCNLTLFRNISKGADLKVSLFQGHLLNRTFNDLYTMPYIQTDKVLFNNFSVFITDEGTSEFQFNIDVNGNTIDASPFIQYTAVTPKDYDSRNRDKLGAYAGV
jgi:hypothetical protein